MGLIARVKNRLTPEDGATAIEYALMVALIAIVIVAAVAFLGQSTNSVYENDQLLNTLT
jgi:pilus assembly protein Flp/PilA